MEDAHACASYILLEFQAVLTRGAVACPMAGQTNPAAPLGRLRRLAPRLVGQILRRGRAITSSIDVNGKNPENRGKDYREVCGISRQPNIFEWMIWVAMRFSR